MVVFQDFFYPLYDFRPPRLHGTTRPEPIVEGDRGSILFCVTLRPRTPEPGSPDCLPVSLLIDRALAAGWTDETAQAPPRAVPSPSC